jgi:type I restriction enzyme R subunit
MSVHQEKHLESYIVGELAKSGWLVGDFRQYDRDRALYPEDVLGWVETNHSEAWAKLQRLHGASAGTAILDRLVKALEDKKGGAVEVLRNGFQIAGGGTLDMSQALPEDSRNAMVLARYKANRLRVVPQVRYSLDNENAIDLVFFLNGIPVATVEVKTEFTQSIEIAKEQYKTDRLPRNSQGSRTEPLLTFRRGAVVHFALSESEIWMTTKLAGASTVFLPFNRGNDGHPGNPPMITAQGYPVSYFWERVLSPDNWLRIFHRFVLLERKQVEDATGKVTFKENLIFPRFHQWEAVIKMIDAVRTEGAGHQYLIEHSAGSGKTHTISWTAHELIRVRTQNGDPYFNSVIVVTDRTVLDAQLQEAIASIDHQTGVVRAIDREHSSLPKGQQLAKALLDGAPIVVVTLQSFPSAMEAILEEDSLQDRKFAVIMDEAHTSQTGSTANKLRQALSRESDLDLATMTPEEILQQIQKVRGLPKNVSHFAFTATPKHSTFSLFGRPVDPAKPQSKENPPGAFHLYTMQQAIEEEFILDVLQNYTSYKVAYRIGERLTAKIRVDAKQARRSLARWVSLHPTNVAQKVDLILEHFQTRVAHLLNGHAKAMVVCSSRAAAVKYGLSFERYIQERAIPGIEVLTAFSGEVSGKDVSDEVQRFPDDHTFTEGSMNRGAPSSDLRKTFDLPQYRVMIVANKFQTGFDQPKLVAMYVDKKISGVEAVQTFSRLNRRSPGKDRTYIIDFVNDPDEILAAFRMFYREAKISDTQDPNVVYDLKTTLDAALIYETDEVRRFGAAMVDPALTHQKLFSLTQPAYDRFEGKRRLLQEAIDRTEGAFQRAEGEGDKQGAAQADSSRAEYTKQRDALMIFSENLSKFVRTYEYIAQLIDFGDADLEALSGFARLLRKRLKGVTLDQIDVSGLQLTHYAIRKNKSSGSLDGNGITPELDPIIDSGSRDPRDRERAYLAELIEKLNKAFGQSITEADKVAFAIHVSEKLRHNTQVMAQVQNNTKEQALRADLPGALVKTAVEALSSHEAIAKKILSNTESRGILMDVVYELLKNDAAAQFLKAARS